jgi:hypothetical protein
MPILIHLKTDTFYQLFRWRFFVNPQEFSRWQFNLRFHSPEWDFFRENLLKPKLTGAVSLNYITGTV